MYVETMTTEEMKVEFNRDFEETLRKEADRRHKFLNAFRSKIVAMIETKRSNKYCIAQERSVDKTSVFMAFALIPIKNRSRTEIGLMTIASNLGCKSDVKSVIVLPHAIRRFKERTGFEGSYDDLIKRMVSSLGCKFRLNLYDNINPYDKNGMPSKTIQTKDGIMLGVVDDNNIYTIKTFVDWDSLYKGQKSDYISEKNTNEAQNKYIAKKVAVEQYIKQII